MSLYAIGDVQGCLHALQRLLDIINFDPATDELWFAGDLVNRGPQSLETLRFIKGLGTQAVCVLGNHDLRLLRVDAGLEEASASTTLAPILKSDDRDELVTWLRKKPVFKLNNSRKLAMVHAGILPGWSLQATQKLAHQIEQILQTDGYKEFLAAVKNQNLSQWNQASSRQQQLAFALNVMTSMRICNQQQKIMFSFKQAPDNIPEGFAAWFDWPHQRNPEFTVIVGHWAALGFVQQAGVIALDTGCVWGKQLTAYRLDSGREKRFSVECAD